MNRNPNQFSPRDLHRSSTLVVLITSIYTRDSSLSRVHLRCVFTMTRLAALRKDRQREDSLENTGRAIPIEMRIRTMAETFRPTFAPCPCRARFADLHLKLKSCRRASTSYASSVMFNFDYRRVLLPLSPPPLLFIYFPFLFFF